MREIAGIKIEWQEKLWKYFRADRFIAAIETGQIYFAAANQFADVFEGAVAVQLGASPVDPRYAEMEPAEKAFFELKRLTKISCWHRAAFESDAMWKLYAGESKGIAITTTPERMRMALRSFHLQPEYAAEDLWGGAVSYVDLTQIRMRGANMVERFFFKHRAFEWEREFRLAISLRTAEEFGVFVPADGILIDVDFSVLIENIFLGPTLSEKYYRDVTQHVDRVGLSNTLRHSSLLGRPRYV